MKNYLSLMIVTRPMIAANARGQGAGNMQMLQHLSSGGASHTVINGVAVSYAMRENMKDLGAKCWRLAGVTDTMSGFGYGPAKAPTMQEGVKGLKQFDYDDTALRGYMVAKKGSGKGAEGESENTIKARGCMQMSPAVSATPYDDTDVAFVKGLKEDGQLNPFTFQRHHARYVMTTTFDLVSLAARPSAINYALDALAKGMQVGGNHTSNLSEFVPEVIAWRFHTVRGSGLFLSPADTAGWAVDSPVTLEPLFAKADDLGIRDEIEVGGLAVNPNLSIAEAFNAIKKAVAEAIDVIEVEKIMKGA